MHPNIGRYSVFNKLTDDARTVAAFQLHLTGPALTWFINLDSAICRKWDFVERAFKTKFVTVNTPVLLVETEMFQNLRLIPGERLEDYFSAILERITITFCTKVYEICKSRTRF